MNIYVDDYNLAPQKSIKDGKWDILKGTEQG